MEQVIIQSRPLSNNKIISWFQKIYRNFRFWWNGYSAKHPKEAPFIKKFFFFAVFSNLVSIAQYLLMIFLPDAFSFLGNASWAWPNIPISNAGGTPYVILGDAKGLGYFVAFEIAVLAAQILNFPLQRNLTFKSHGNVYIQALAYFIGWALVSFATSALWGIINVYLIYYNIQFFIGDLLKNLLTGLVSTIVFFFIFLWIFPDYEKVYKRQQARLEKFKNKKYPQAIVQRQEKITSICKKNYELDYSRHQYEKAEQTYDYLADAYERKVRQKEELSKSEDSKIEQIERVDMEIENRYKEALEGYNDLQEKKKIYEETYKFYFPNSKTKFTQKE